jgi:glycosyltransferase involved in cell wall biosynthesis
VSNPLVSVVMCVFNGERFLSEAINSILCQSFRDFDFVIVDDGSTDGSTAIVDRYQKSESRIHVCRHETNQGLVAAHNTGFARARGKYIALMAADDVAVRDRLMWQVEFLETHPDIGLLGGATEWIDATGRVLRAVHYPLGDREIRLALASECPFASSAVLIRTSVLASVGGFRRAFRKAEDYDMWLRVADHCRLGNLDRVVLRYRVHPSQASHTNAREMSLCRLAAQTSAVFRKNNRPDPIEKVVEITAPALAAMGVSEAEQNAALGQHYWFWVRTLSTSGECAAALLLADGLFASADWRHVERWIRSDVRLEMAMILWKEKRFLRSLVSVFDAIVTRPALLARPVKPFLCWLGSRWRFAQITAESIGNR